MSERKTEKRSKGEKGEEGISTNAKEEHEGEDAERGAGGITVRKGEKRRALTNVA